MWLEKLFAAISDFLPDPDLPQVEKVISSLNPDKIYVENIRSTLGVSSASAQRFCETAARQGVFKRRVEVLCPDGSVAASADSESELPETVQCWEEEDGDYEGIELRTDELRKNVYYALNREAATASTGREVVEHR